MSKEKQIETTDWLTRGIPKEQLEREKREAIMSADLQGCITYDEWSAREYGIDLIDFDTTSEKMVAKGYRKQEWISVEERLPKEVEHIIVCDEDGTVGEAIFLKASRLFEWVDNEEIAFATHWMPLPEAPKMKGGAE